MGSTQRCRAAPWYDSSLAHHAVSGDDHLWTVCSCRDSNEPSLECCLECGLLLARDRLDSLLVDPDQYSQENKGARSRAQRFSLPLVSLCAHRVGRSWNLSRMRHPVRESALPETLRVYLSQLQTGSERSYSARSGIMEASNYASRWGYSAVFERAPTGLRPVATGGAQRNPWDKKPASISPRRGEGEPLLPSPLRGEMVLHPTIHGFRCAPPVATSRCPFGAYQMFEL